MSKDGPCNVAVFELLNRDFASECTVWLVKDVLCSNLETWSEVFAGQEKVERRW